MIDSSSSRRQPVSSVVVSPRALAERAGQARQDDRRQPQAELVGRAVIDEPERQRQAPDERVAVDRLVVAAGEVDELVGRA